MKKNEFTFDNCLRIFILLYIISLFVFNNISSMKTNFVSLILFLICFLMISYSCLKRHKFKIDDNLVIYLLFLIAGFLSIFYATNKDFVLHKTMQLLINAAIIFIFINFLNSSKKVDFVLRAFLYSGVIVAFLIIFTTNYSEVSHLNRPGSQIGNVNSLSILMIMSLSTLMILKNKNSNKKIYLPFEFTIVLAILLTGSRKGILALLILYFMSFILKNYYNKKILLRNIFISLGIICFALIVIYFNSYLHDIIWSRLANFMDFLGGNKVDEFSINARNNMIKIGLEWFKKKPLFGYGLDNYRYFYNNLFGYDYYAHNNYIELLVDLGVFGTTIYYTLILVPLIKLFKMNILKNYEVCIYFSMLLISLVLDCAWVSYLERVWLIYLSIIYSYIYLNKKQKNSKVSVIMATYKTDEKLLRESIESILNQTYTNFEFIIVNDGNAEDLRVIKSYTDKRILIINNEKNMGLPYSLNKAIEIAAGKYIARMDSDDIAVEDRLKIQVDYMEKHQDIQLCGMFAKNIGNKSGLSLNPLYRSDVLQIQLLYKCSLIHPTVMIRRNFLVDNNIKYNESFRYAQDYELWSRCNKISKISIIPTVGLLLRSHNSQISTQKKLEQDNYYLQTLKGNMRHLNIDDKFTSCFLVLNGRKKLSNKEVKKFCNNLNYIVAKLEPNYKNVNAVINNSIFNLYLKGELFTTDSRKINNSILKKRIFNFSNIYLSIKRVYLSLKCKLMLIIEYH